MAARTFDQLLTAYPSSVRAVAGSARRLIFELLPDAEETVTLILSKQGVKLGVVRGAELADPKKLLTGADKVHRYVPLAKPDDVRRPGLRPLLRSAAAPWRDRRRREA